MDQEERLLPARVGGDHALSEMRDGCALGIEVEGNIRFIEW